MSGTGVTWLLVGLAVLGMAAYLVVQPKTTRAPTLQGGPANVVAIKWRAADLSPAPAAGRICVTDPAHGQLCADYVVGDRPADTLTRRLAQLGLQVESRS